MAFGRSAFGRRAKADGRFASYQCRFVRLLCFGYRLSDSDIIMPVNANGIPAHCLKTQQLVSGAGLIYRTVDGDVIVIPENN